MKRIFILCFAVLAMGISSCEKQKEHEAFPNKIITLSECGNGDKVKMAALSNIWTGGATFSWFMTWYDYNYNTGKSTTHSMAPKEWWQAAFKQDFVLTRNDWIQLNKQ